MIKQIFYATVSDDLTLKFLNIAKFKNHLLKLKGKTVALTCEERKKHRSNEQNAYYWGVVLKTIADYAGYRGEQEITGIHEELKRMFLPKIGKLNIVKSTSSLNTAAMSPVSTTTGAAAKTSTNASCGSIWKPETTSTLKKSWQHCASQASRLHWDKTFRAR